MAGLDEKFKSMTREQLDIQGKLKPVERQNRHSDKGMENRVCQLTAERNALNQRYLVLKGEVKEAKQIRNSVYSIL